MGAKVWLLAAAALAGSISSACVATPAFAQAPSGLCEREMMRASSKYGVPIGMLYSVGLTETGRRGSLQPYAMNVEGKAVFSNSAAEAMQRFEEASRSGAKLIDLGCMQINHLYHRENFPSLASMLDPRMNVEYAARFLRELKTRHETWTMAVARYHAGPNNDPAQKRYVCRVIANMVATGFGQWTPGARTFCADAPGLSSGQTASDG
ncbi:transglycosylase SLT domain-containing protein [Microvirga mediterraneensis]|uniref:Lytic transglycosylase domain-containing protein n=1 Tax=Microvirga mediterraneensis TaxID=2754695 RepID=A0A838BJ66_9HYPH|nr:lytic transglycosylase domain-containing protein [Microvirga mediterraneensis]MBA1154722.1 lytic transglycosylase domain-containing protein [Microvirga mediterraneensis]